MSAIVSRALGLPVTVTRPEVVPGARPLIEIRVDGIDVLDLDPDTARALAHEILRVIA